MKHPDGFALISKEWMIAVLSQQKKDAEKQDLLGSQGTQNCKRRSRGHLHFRGPGCVFFDVLQKQKKQIALLSLS